MPALMASAGCGGGVPYEHEDRESLFELSLNATTDTEHFTSAPLSSHPHAATCKKAQIPPSLNCAPL